ncbi:MAG TPA: SDR family NAD(P)-dependent oxidoreductase [Candidatus Angelobacter sp.]|nr:SDR family NAD(P)-dependent oxidoreductase [Candidatus Angelobacter sp.]
MTENSKQPAEPVAGRDGATIWTPAEARGAAPGRGRLQGARILVVGAGSQPCDEPDPPMGNGRAIALLCAREGAAVACVDKDESAARQTRDQIVQEGGTASVMVADVSREQDCERLVEGAIRDLKGIDGVVLNVGIGAGRGLAATSAQQWDEVFAVNLRAHFLIARAVLPHLHVGAAIVFVSSVASLRPGTNVPAYDASKAGLGGLCRHVAFEGSRRGVRANVVTPGLIDTPLGRAASRGRPARAETTIPLGRQGTAWEVAYATLFLLSGEASYITGQMLVVDGGLSQLR